jgi:hypothetical protein
MTALVAAATLALLAGLAGAAAAQSDPLEPTATTGTLQLVEPAVDATVPDADASHVHTWTAEDPRLSGTVTYTGSWQLYDPASEECDVPAAEPAARYEIVNEGGGWTCSGVRAPIPGPDGASNVHALALTGTGGYEGLHAYVMVDWSTDPVTFSALITPNEVSIYPEIEG